MMAGDNGKATRGSVRSERRREELRRTLGKQGVDLKAIFLRRELVSTLLIFLAFTAVVSALTIFSHHQPKVVEGQVMSAPRQKRLDFTVVNEALTEQQREQARERAPHVFSPNTTYIEEVRSALMGLPRAVRNTPFTEVAASVRDQFGLDEARLAIAQQHMGENEPDEQWTGWVNKVLIEQGLYQHPVLTTQEFQVEAVRAEPPEFLDGDGVSRRLKAIELNADATEAYRAEWQRQLQESGLPSEVASIFAARLAWQAQPTYGFDRTQTERRRSEEAAKVEDVRVVHHAGELIYERGDILTLEQLSLLDREEREYRANTPFVVRFGAGVGVVVLMAIVAMFLMGYLVRFYPRIIRNMWRVAAIAGLCALSLAITVWIGVTGPQYLYFVSVSAALLVAMMMVIAYDQRLAAIVATLQCAIMAFAMEQTLGYFIVLLGSCGASIAMLRELRHRNTLIRAALMAAIVSSICALMLGFYEMPLVSGTGEFIGESMRQIIARAGMAAAGSLGVGFLLLGLLPSIERMFDMTTGMTLMELRDPRQPLLRQLQERAPGTYNHSLQVANIAEAAADAINADSLLAYVGALYHDIGKMNKPDYFVENQSGGPNRHAKLSPAMSLLVIVGHVKDGIELAREYNIPRTLIHFIESHHGTTLVEYFYHAARSKAALEGERIRDVEYRYPGPRPRTKEAAILMLSDASESAARAMEEPGPAAIENLVRKLARKRLMDGQFDECDLTLRELAAIEDSIIRSIWALHHGRISYPSASGRSKEGESTSPATSTEPAEPATRSSAG